MACKNKIPYFEMKAYMEIKKSIGGVVEAATCQPAGNSWEEEQALKIWLSSKIGRKAMVSTYDPRSI